MKAPKWIVIAWTITEQVWDGNPFARDLGGRPALVTSKTPRALVWCRNGTPADLQKAEQWVNQENQKRDADEGQMRIFTYPGSETEPLEKARLEIVKV